MKNHVRLTCSQCGAVYDRAAAATACSACAEHGSCGRSRCPYCGHEEVPVPVLSFFARLRRRFTHLYHGGRHGSSTR